MSKSVIVIDTPKTCFDCKGYVCIDNVNYCIYTRNIRYIPNKPTWCPLKALPDKLQKQKVKGFGIGAEYTLELTDYEVGWNECLKYIEGDKDGETKNG